MRELFLRSPFGPTKPNTLLAMESERFLSELHLRFGLASETETPPLYVLCCPVVDNWFRQWTPATT